MRCRTLRMGSMLGVISHDTGACQKQAPVINLDNTDLKAVCAKV